MNGIGLVLTLARLGAPPVDTAVVRDIQVAPGEILRTTTVGTGQPLVLIPGLFGAAYTYRMLTGPLAAERLSDDRRRAPRLRLVVASEGRGLFVHARRRCG